MFSPKFLKFFLLAALTASACRFWQAQTTDAPPTPPVVGEEIKSDVPFATKEPEVFQTEIDVTANGVETLIFMARNGANRLTVFDYQTKAEYALLQTGAGSSFLINRSRKVYAENQTANDSETDDVLPVAELLNEKHAANFQSLGTENNLTKYRVILDASTNSEIVVTVDAQVNLPIKQEFYSVAGERRTLVSTTELKNFETQTDASNFDLPKDYKQISMPEFQEIRRREPTK